MGLISDFFRSLLPWYTRDTVPNAEKIEFFDVWRAEQDHLDTYFEAFGTQKTVDHEPVDAPAEAAVKTQMGEAELDSKRAGNAQPKPPIDKTTLPRVKRGVDRDGRHKTVGLALSGGGIRAASFSLGVMQGLNLNRGAPINAVETEVRMLQEVDYLSTVSGGGYAGAAFTYYRQLHHTRQAMPSADQTELPNVDLRLFPEPEKDVLMRHESRMLDFTRFRRDHLTPTRSLNPMSMAAVTLRTMLNAWPVYLAALSLFMALYYTAAWLVLGYLFGDVTVMVLGCAGADAATTSLCGLNGEVTAPVSAFISQIYSVITDPIFASVGTDGIDRGPLALSLILLGLSVFVFAIISILGLPIAGRALYNGGFHYRMRRLSQKTLGWVVFGLIVSLILVLVPLAADYFFDPDNPGRRAYLISILLGGNILGGFSLASLTGGSIVKRVLTTKVLIILAAIIIIIGNVILAYEIAEFLIIQLNAWFLPDIFVPASAQQPLYLFWLLVGAVLLFFSAGWITNLNYVSLHRMYRDRLMEAFMPNARAFFEKRNADPASEADRLLLTSCKHRPLHIVNTNVVLTNSRQSRYRGRFGDSFILSPIYCGSWATGYRETTEFSAKPSPAPRPASDADGKADQQGAHDPGMTLATAMAISGAAVNPRVGPSGWDSVLANPIVASMASFFNLRLGCWVANPSARAQDTQAHFFNAGLQGLLNTGFEEKNSKLVELTDGGHFENTGLFELLRRRTDLIILSDATADKAFNFKDIGIAIERARVDQSIDIRFLDGAFDLTHLMPGSAGDTHYDGRYKLSQRGFALAKIDYPAFTEPGRNGAKDRHYAAKSGLLIYLKPVMTRKLPADIYSYKGAFDGFPYQPITDQMFDESQFEAYRELGYRITEAMVDTLESRLRDFLAADSGEDTRALVGYTYR